MLRQIFLDTETTGLEIRDGNKIIEIEFYDVSMVSNSCQFGPDTLSSLRTYPGSCSRLLIFDVF